MKEIGMVLHLEGMRIIFLKIFSGHEAVLQCGVVKALLTTINVEICRNQKG